MRALIWWLVIIATTPLYVTVVILVLVLVGVDEVTRRLTGRGIL